MAHRFIRNRSSVRHGESIVKDLSLADSGRRKLKRAEVKMPGLMAVRTLSVPSKPLKDVNITCSLNITTHTGVLVEALTALGANVRLCSSNISSTDDHVAAAIARDSAIVFARDGQTPEQYWSCTARAVDWGLSTGPHLILDHGGDLTMLIYKGVEAEKEFASKGTFPDLGSTNDVASKAMLTIISESLKSDPMKYHKIKDGIVGVTMENTTGANMLLQMQNSGTLLFTAISVREFVSNIMFANNLTGGCQSLPDDLMDATDVMIAGKVVVVLGYGDTGKACAAALKQARAVVIVAEIDPVFSHQATIDGIQVQLLKDVVSMADIFVTTTGYNDMIMVEDMRKMKNDAILCNIGSSVIHIDMVGLETFPGVKKFTTSPITDRWVFTDTGRVIIVLAEGRPMNLSCATGPPSFAISTSLTNQVIALLELWNERSSGKYEKKVYEFPEHLEEEVAALHLETLGEDQADQICVQVPEEDHLPVQSAYDRYGVGQCLNVCGIVISFLTLILAVVGLVLRFGGE
ncbi:Adenosylhomocysteinase [Heracleum sosnowskyi]|uniref:Adenosylhomocysteinase n=1 Tax=Heracleum sosnowskyi TaxID=360622 RepID=A0AAD8IAV5_9APIA|nr:Adenosylhomocysteinase [Heracleum sosnowskyi]